MGTTGIEWTDAVWNCVVGCSKVSPGCEHCYAETLTRRFDPAWRPWTAPNAARNVRLHSDRLEIPLHWRKPRRVFVNSMSDLFHEQVPDQFIDQVFAVMALTPQHTYQILSKRPERMREYVGGGLYRQSAIHVAMGGGDWSKLARVLLKPPSWPLPNVWLGVSAEDQRRADERIPELLATPAAVRFVSCEPLHGPIDLGVAPWTRKEGLCRCPTCDGCGSVPPWGEVDMSTGGAMCPTCEASGYLGLDWVIVGGESGPQARSCDVEWIRSIVAQCKGADVPVFVKQLGAKPYAMDSRRSIAAPMERTYDWQPVGADPDCVIWYHPRDRKGADPAEWPEDLRVRGFPDEVR